MSFTSRRRFLTAATAAVLAGGIPMQLARGEEADTKPLTGFIDAHSHIWTRDIERFPLNPESSLEKLDPPSFTTEELFELIRPHGVDRVVLIQHRPFHGWDNSYVLDAARRFPANFRVVAMIDDRAGDTGKKMRELSKQHATGFRIGPGAYGEKWLEGEGMAEMWRTAAETRQNMCCLVNPGDLEAVDAMCARFPETPVVIDHLGRVGISGEIREEDTAALCKLARHKHVRVKVSAFYALGAKKPPHTELAPLIRRVVEAFGCERLMWASDCPYQLLKGNTYEASLALITEKLDFLTADDRDRLLRRTAEETFQFPRAG